MDVSVVRASAAKGTRSETNRPTNSAAMCWQSDADPPLPQSSTLPWARNVSVTMDVASAIAKDNDSSAANTARCSFRLFVTTCCVIGEYFTSVDANRTGKS